VTMTPPANNNSKKPVGEQDVTVISALPF